MTAETQNRTSRWPWLVVGILGSVVIVNVIMLYFATRQPPLLESDDAYETSLTYDQVLAARQATAALGWSAVVEQRPDGLRWTFTDRAGAPIQGLAGQISLSRADTRAHDRTVPFAEVTPGSYQAAWDGAPGQYRAEIELKRGEERWVESRQMQLR